MSKIILGLDISLVETGYCVYSTNCTVCGVIKSSPRKNRFERYDHILSKIAYIVNTHKPDLAIIEGYAFGCHGRAVFDLAEIGGIIKHWCYNKGLLFHEIPPTTLKKWATGKGNATKDIMMLKCYKRFGIEFTNNNECDAYLLARYGEEHYDGIRIQTTPSDIIQ